MGCVFRSWGCWCARRSTKPCRCFRFRLRHVQKNILTFNCKWVPITVIHSRKFGLPFIIFSCFGFMILPYRQTKCSRFHFCRPNPRRYFHYDLITDFPLSDLLWNHIANTDPVMFWIGLNTAAGMGNPVPIVPRSTVLSPGFEVC